MKEAKSKDEMRRIKQIFSDKELAILRDAGTKIFVKKQVFQQGMSTKLEKEIEILLAKNLKKLLKLLQAT